MILISDCLNKKIISKILKTSPYNVISGTSEEFDFFQVNFVDDIIVTLNIDKKMKSKNWKMLQVVNTANDSLISRQFINNIVKNGNITGNILDYNNIGIKN